MKSLLLIRHAKSSWTDAGMDDIDRPLNDRGKKDAPVMANRLIKRDLQIDAFISSSAIRAQQTCLLFMQVFNRKKNEMIIKPELYLAMPETFLQLTNSLNDEFNSVAIFSHNPGITDFANSLTNTKVDDMPTCSIYAVTAAIKKWKQFGEAEEKFWFFDYPKNKAER